MLICLYYKMNKNIFKILIRNNNFDFIQNKLETVYVLTNIIINLSFYIYHRIFIINKQTKYK